jgi:hypothetical protein
MAQWAKWPRLHIPTLANGLHTKQKVGALKGRLAGCGICEMLGGWEAGEFKRWWSSG